MVSLVGYTMPSAYAATHGAAYTGSIAAIAGVHCQAEKEQAALSDLDSDSDHNEHSGEAPHNPTEKSCCGDFCYGAALPCGSQSAGIILSSVIRSFADDSDEPGTNPGLHRPPNI